MGMNTLKRIGKSILESFKSSGKELESKVTKNVVEGFTEKFNNKIVPGLEKMAKNTDEVFYDVKGASQIDDFALSISKTPKLNDNGTRTFEGLKKIDVLSNEDTEKVKSFAESVIKADSTTQVKDIKHMNEVSQIFSSQLNGSTASSKKLGEGFLNNVVKRHMAYGYAARGIAGISAVGGTINVAGDLLSGRSPLKDKYGRTDIPYIPGV